MFIYLMAIKFSTFDEARYSHHLIYFAWTALLLISKAKVDKILCDQVSVNMAGQADIWTRDLV